MNALHSTTHVVVPSHHLTTVCLRAACLLVLLTGSLGSCHLDVMAAEMEVEGNECCASHEVDSNHAADPFSENSLESIDDPWEGFNSTMFAFNQSVDRYAIKPLATGYDWIVPDPVERAIGRAFHNVRFVPRVLNNLFQGKWQATGRELGRFAINSTIGVAGLFDVADQWFGLGSPAGEDAGQTLAVYGVEPGPYLVLPLLSPTTVRDGVGFLGDLVFDPLTLFLPLAPQIVSRAGETVNDRSRNLELLDGLEQSTLDLYSAARNAYAQARTRAIRE
ncbi:MAG: VacJ family lipoprotein [Nitrospiraceae bacterium]